MVVSFAPTRTAPLQSNSPYTFAIPHTTPRHDIHSTAWSLLGWIKSCSYCQVLLFTCLLFSTTTSITTTTPTPQYRRVATTTPHNRLRYWSSPSRISSEPSTSRVWDRGKARRVSGSIALVPIKASTSIGKLPSSCRHVLLQHSNPTLKQTEAIRHTNRYYSCSKYLHIHPACKLRHPTRHYSLPLLLSGTPSSERSSERRVAKTVPVSPGTIYLLPSNCVKQRFQCTNQDKCCQFVESLNSNPIERQASLSKKPTVESRNYTATVCCLHCQAIGSLNILSLTLARLDDICCRCREAIPKPATVKSTKHIKYSSQTDSETVAGNSSYLVIESLNRIAAKQLVESLKTLSTSVHQTLDSTVNEVHC